MDPNLTADERRAGRRAAWFWGSFVCCFLGMQLAIGAVAIVLATNDPSVAVVPDYYQKALDWDKSQAAQAASDQLGWSGSIQVGEALDAKGTRLVSMVVSDSSGLPVNDLRGQLRLFHQSRAMERQIIDLDAMGSGVYQGKAVMARDGLWDFDWRLDGEATQAAFLHHEMLDLDSSSEDRRGLK